LSAVGAEIAEPLGLLAEAHRVDPAGRFAVVAGRYLALSGPVCSVEPPQTRGISSISPEILRNRELVDGERSIRTLRRPSMESCPAQFHHVFSCPY
jgi:hypothetical protein